MTLKNRLHLLLVGMLSVHLLFAQDDCAGRADFDWDDNTGTPTGNTYVDEAVSFTYSVAGSGGITVNTTGNNLATGISEFNTSWEITQTAGNTNTFTIDFNGDLLYDFCFELVDVDNGGGNNIVTVNGFDNTNTLVTLTDPDDLDFPNFNDRIQYNGANEFEGTGDSPTNFIGFILPRGNVTICFPVPIQRIEIVFNSAAATGDQDFAIADFNYCSQDFDNDGVQDDVDTDADGDGILNTVEGYTPGDLDGDGIPNVYDADFAGRVDANGDNTDDNFDTDLDGAPDALDLDSDNDGILDAVENLPTSGGLPANTDGVDVADYLDDDSDGDGVTDAIEGNDIDFNGVADRTLANTDADGDGIDDNLDTVFGLETAGNATGSAAAVAANLVDDDTTPDYRDTDDDGDGTLTSAELTDTNGDGIPDYISACADGSALNFDGFALGSTPGPVFNVDGVDLTFSFTDPFDATQEYEIDNAIQGENYVRVLQTLSSNTAFTLLRVNFDKPLEGFCFDLLDIDEGGEHVDSMAVNIFRDGDVIVLDGTNIINAGNNQLNANNFVVGTANSDDDEFLGNVRLCLLQSVDSLVIRYGNAIAPAGDQAIGLDDFSWCGIDSDYDEILDFDDPDDNNNGIADIVEGGGVDHSLDTDGDKIPDYLDTDFLGFVDSNADGVNDNADLDLDGIPDQVDKDTDNDGIPDAVEANGGLLPANMDEDGAYPPAYSLANDSDGDGIVNDVDTSTGGTALANPNSDGDAVNDFRDLDSDNDGIPDLVEAGGTDAGGDGRVDSFADATGDGLNDAYDPDVFGTTLLAGSISKFAIDNDDDGIANYINIDSDGDGITDDVEGQTSTGFVAPAGADTDGDGWDDNYDSDNGGTTPPLTDTDTDTIPDYLDTDSDGDGIGDSIEGRDDDSDGVADELASGTDTDSDGLDDAYDTDCSPCGAITGVAAPTQDLDVDTRPDYRDIDDDGDGLISSSEDFSGNGNFADDFTQGGPSPDYLQFTDDPDGDGVANASDSDDNNDGIPDTEQSDVTDFDGDGIVDRYDLDIDGDGIPNAFEANDGSFPPNMDENGQYPSTYATANDSDGDGLVDDIDNIGGAFTGGTPLPNNDFDGDGLDDFEDADTDGDGIPDSIESTGTDTNANGIPDSFTDTDTDGNLDYRDGDSDNDGVSDLREGQTTAAYIGAPSGTDTDGDGISDSFDADNGGIAIIGNDHDSDGTPDFQDTDSDNDGIVDITDSNDNNTDGVADATLSGTDTDGDGIDNTFDPDNGGSAVALQNTDGNAEPDWRDSDDDGDGTPTTDENVDTNPANGTPDYLESNGNTCGIGRVNVAGQNALAVESSTGIGGGGDAAALGAPDYDPGDGTGPLAVIGAGDELDLDLGFNLDAGTVITVHFTAGAVNDAIDVTSSVDNVTYGDLFTHLSTIAFTAEETFTYTTVTDGIRYLRFVLNTGVVAVDAVVFDACAFDSDNDGVQDDADNDSDNDGLTDITEGNGTDPTADLDTDGLANYLDPDFGGYEDANSDGINDNFDQDLDGIPNHQDLDSDNDGLPDAVEANTGVLPANMTAEGTYLASYVRANDGDADGHADDVDTDSGGTALANPDSDFGTGYDDGLVDFLDRDSDNDGITDAAENDGTDVNRDGAIDSFIDTDNDGLIDSLDPDNGGFALSVVNTDGDGSPDYLDTDSDNDSAGLPGLGDLFEGHDSNFDGTPSWDDDADLTLDTAEGNIDLDGDGIVDAFDPDQGGIGASLPNADGDGLANFRDNDDDDDGVMTISEDRNGDGNYFNDFTEGQSGSFASVPDYLYNDLSPLPVELLSFKAVLDGSKVKLTWITAQELNNDRFEVEHSDDGLSFKTVGTVKGNGTISSVSDYTFTHSGLSTGFHYYRLKQVDFDGQFEYSSIERVSLGAFEDVSIRIHPNPSEDVANIRVNEGIATLFEILTMKGTVLKSIEYRDGASSHTFDISQFNKGIYLVRVQGPDLNTIKRLVVK